MREIGVGASGRGLLWQYVLKSGWSFPKGNAEGSLLGRAILWVRKSGAGVLLVDEVHRLRREGLLSLVLPEK